jgi:hypothetical protein
MLNITEENNDVAHDADADALTRRAQRLEHNQSCLDQLAARGYRKIAGYRAEIRVDEASIKVHSYVVFHCGAEMMLTPHRAPPSRRTPHATTSLQLAERLAAAINDGVWWQVDTQSVAFMPMGDHHANVAELLARYDY